MADRLITVLAVVGVAAAGVVAVVLAARLVGLTDKVSAAFFAKNRLLLGSALVGGVILAVGYVAGSALLMWTGAGLLGLLVFFFLAAS